MTDKSVLPPAWKVPQEFRHRLGVSVGRQRPMFAAGHLLLVLHAPPKPEDNVRIGRFFWRTAEGTWSSKELGSGISAVNKHLDQYEDIIAELDRQEEEAQTAEEYFDVLERISPIYRAARNQHQVLQEARKLCPEYRDLIDLRDRAYSIERTAELLFAGTQHSLDFAVAKRAEEEAQASQRMAVAAHRLNTLAALFFPIVTLTAILGVDLQTLAAILGLDVETVVEKGLAPVIFLGLILLGVLGGVILTLFANRASQAESDRRPGAKSLP